MSGKLTVEWTLPPIRFQRAGIPSLYANWLQFSLFTSGIDANFDSTLPRRQVADRPVLGLVRRHLYLRRVT